MPWDRVRLVGFRVNSWIKKDDRADSLLISALGIKDWLLLQKIPVNVRTPLIHPCLQHHEEILCWSEVDVGHVNGVDARDDWLAVCVGVI